jgi:hypothetical protein
MKKTSVEHDFSDHDQVATPLPTDNLGAAGFMMCEAMTLIAQANRRGALLRRCHSWITENTYMRMYWDNSLRELIEAIEAEPNLPSPNPPGDKT